MSNWWKKKKPTVWLSLFNHEHGFLYDCCVCYLTNICRRHIMVRMCVWVQKRKIDIRWEQMNINDPANMLYWGEWQIIRITTTTTQPYKHSIIRARTHLNFIVSLGTIRKQYCKRRTSFVARCQFGNFLLKCKCWWWCYDENSNSNNKN